MTGEDQRARLGRMAGQIADFFSAYPEDQAVGAVAEHINQFWSKRMRADFLELYGASAEGLHPLAAKALSQVRRPAG